MNSNQREINPVIFDDDMTVRWSCRQGDLIAWIRCKDFLSWPDDPLSIRDLPQFVSTQDYWVMRKGEFATITNRIVDLPKWLELHPSEVCGAAAFWMMEKFENGYQPTEPVCVPNLWRVRAGDRLIWMGVERAGMRSVNGILALVDLASDAAVIGDSTGRDFDLVSFGDSFGTRAEALMLRAAAKAVSRLGIPNTWSASEWRIGGPA